MMVFIDLNWQIIKSKKHIFHMFTMKARNRIMEQACIINNVKWEIIQSRNQRTLNNLFGNK